MNPKLSRRWTLVSILLLLASAGWIGASKAQPEGATNGRIPSPRRGFLAPDFSLQSLSGEKASLADLRGKAVLVNLWASWCAPCRAEMPAIQRVYRDYREKGLEILAVNTTVQEANPGDPAAFAQELGLTFPILLDTEGTVSQAYQLRALPTSFFIDPEGVIQEVVVGGPMSEALLRVRVEQLLEEQR